MTRPLLRIALLAATAVLPLRAQISLTVNGVDASSYPTVRVSFDAKDRNGAHIGSFQPSDFTVVEDGIARPVTKVTCPPPVTPPISITLAIDVSFSMSLAGRMNNAKVAASEMVNSLSYPPAATGIVTFDDTTQIYLPYTSDAQVILDSISHLTTTNGGTDYVGAFLDKITGAIDVTKNRTGTRYIIFLTDGAVNLTAVEEQSIIAAANAAGVRVYTLTMTPNTIFAYSLRRIATGTGGLWFEDITTQQKAEDAFAQILQFVYTYDPCTLEYVTDGCETSRTADITLRKNGSSATRSIAFQVPASSIVTLEASTNLLDFGVLPAGSSRTLDVVYTARNGPVTVSAMSIAAAGFTLVSYGGSAPPFTLAANDARTVRVQYRASDTSLATGLVTIATTAPCVTGVVLAGGVYHPDALTLVQPNGGEVLFAGSSYQLKWRGVPVNQVVALEYSTDAGGSWWLITPTAYSLSTSWTVRNTPSDSCLGLVRTPEIRASARDANWLPSQPAEVRALAFATGGTLLAAGLTDGRIKLYYPATGTLIDILAGHTARVNAVAFSRDGRFLASASDDGTVRVWDAAAGTVLHTFGGLGAVHSVAFGADNATLAAADQNAVTVWNTSDWSQRWRSPGTSSAAGAIAIAPDGAWMVSAVGSNIAVLRFSDGGTLRTLSGHAAAVRALAVSNDGRTIASGSDDRSIGVWSTPTWTLSRFLTGHTNAVTSVALSTAGLFAVSGSRDRTVRVWDTRSGTVTQTFSGHTGDVNAVEPEGRTALIASGGLDRALRVWGYAPPQADLSDSLWSIITPTTTLVTDGPVFPDVVCPDGTSDGTVTVTNTGNSPVTITGASFVGLDSLAFAFAPGFSIPPQRTLKPEDTLIIPLRFLPTVAKDYVADLLLSTDAASNPIVDVALVGHKDSVGVAAVPDTIDVGERYSCTVPASVAVALSNTGTVDARVDSVDGSPSGLVSIGAQLPRTLSPGAVDTLHIAVYPTAPGPFTATLTLGVTPCDARVPIVVRGSRSPSTPLATPALLRFPFTSVGDTSRLGCVLHNPTGVPMTIEAPLAAILPFALVSPTVFPLVIPPHDSIAVTFAFAPDVEGDTVHVVTFPCSAPCADSVAVRLEGSSARKPEIAGFGATFRTLLCPDDRYSDTTIVLTNTGGETLVIGSMTIAGADSAEFVLLSPPSLSLDPGDSTTVSLRFVPRAPGARSAALVVSSNAFNAPLLSLPLAARKDSASLEVTPALVDVGDVYPCEAPLRRTITARNTGTVPLSTSAVLAALPPAFHFATNPFPRTIAPGDSISWDVLFDPQAFAVSAGSFDVRATACAIDASVTVRGTYRTSAPVPSTLRMDFGTLGSGTSGQRTVTIVNPTGRGMRLSGTSLGGATYASVLAPASLPAVIPAGDSLLVVVEYAPAGSDTLAATLVLTFDAPCADTLRIAMTGAAQAAFSDILAPEMTAAVGDVVHIPLAMTRSANLALNGVRSFRTELLVTRSVLWPRSVRVPGGGGSFTTAVEQDSLLRVTITADEGAPPTNGTLAELECLVMLGTTDVTRLRIDAFDWTNGSAAVTTTDGLLHVTGICEQGGPRLMSLPGAVMKFTAHPNPFNPSTIVTLELSDALPVDLRVYDALGRLSQVLCVETLDAGAHSFLFAPVTDSGGAYYAVLRSGSAVDVRQLVLLK